MAFAWHFLYIASRAHTFHLPSGKPMRTSIVILLCVLSAYSAYTQWSSDPNANLQLCDVAGEQALPKIANTSDGGCYVCWFDSRSGSYAVYLQRLDSLGVKQFAADGLLVSSNPQNSSLVDYDMAVDDSDNAIIIFTDIRNSGAINPFAYKIGPDGSFRWGANGVQLSDSFSVYQPNPKVRVTSDGYVVVIWIFASTPRKVAMQKLSPAGVKQWGADAIYLSGEGVENLDYPSLVRSDSGSVILMWSGYTGSFLNPQNYRIYSQKFSTSGAPVWGANPDTVYILGRVAGFFVPKIFPDGSDGAFYVWQDDRFSQNLTSSYVQHFSSTGDALFPADGVAGSTQSARNHFDAWVTYFPSTQETFMCWKESNTLQSLFAVYGQKLSSDGTRLWPDTGAAFTSFGQNGIAGISCLSEDTSAIVYYDDLIFGGVNSQIKSFRVERSGVLGWNGTIVTASSAPGEKLRLVSAIGADGMSKLAWSDRRNDAGGIYAQNIRFDGTLGLPPVHSIHIVSPNGGEVWRIGETHDLIWTSEGVDTVKIEFSQTGSGGPYFLITASYVGPETLSYLAGGPPSTDCFFRVAWASSPLVFDTNDSAFSILDSLSSVDEMNDLPGTYFLGQNFPNPFNPSTVIRYTLAVTSYTTLKVYDILGQEVATLVNEEMKPGCHEVTWGPAGLSSGVYFYRLQAGTFTETKKLILIR